AVVERSIQLIWKFDRLIPCDDGRQRDDASVARREVRALPEVAEQTAFPEALKGWRDGIQIRCFRFEVCGIHGFHSFQRFQRTPDYGRRRCSSSQRNRLGFMNEIHESFALRRVAVSNWKSSCCGRCY